MMNQRHTDMIRSYVIGFILSLSLTLASYTVAVSSQANAVSYSIAVLIGLAIVQIIVQVIYFLHLAREPKPRWNTIAFITMVMVVLFIVVGSIWIMNNLNYNMMHNDKVETMMMHDEGIEP